MNDLRTVHPISDLLWILLRQHVWSIMTTSQTGYDDAGGSGHRIAARELQLRDLPSNRLLGEGLAGIGYETEWNGKSCARKDFVRGPTDIFKEVADLVTAGLVGLEVYEIIVNIHGWAVDRRSCSLVMECMDDDLSGLLQKRTEIKLNRANMGSVTYVNLAILSLLSCKMH